MLAFIIITASEKEKTFGCPAIWFRLIHSCSFLLPSLLRWLGKDSSTSLRPGPSRKLWIPSLSLLPLCPRFIKCPALSCFSNQFVSVRLGPGKQKPHYVFQAERAVEPLKTVGRTDPGGRGISKKPFLAFRQIEYPCHSSYQRRDFPFPL